MTAKALSPSPLLPCQMERSLRLRARLGSSKAADRWPSQRSIYTAWWPAANAPSRSPLSLTRFEKLLSTVARLGCEGGRLRPGEPPGDLHCLLDRGQGVVAISAVASMIREVVERSDAIGLLVGAIVQYISSKGEFPARERNWQLLDGNSAKSGFLAHARDARSDQKGEYRMNTQATQSLLSTPTRKRNKVVSAVDAVRLIHDGDAVRSEERR